MCSGQKDAGVLWPRFDNSEALGGRARSKRGNVSRDGPDADREGELGTESSSAHDHEGQLQGR